MHRRPRAVVPFVPLCLAFLLRWRLSAAYFVLFFVFCFRWGEDQPSFAPASSGSGGNCYGYVNVPGAVACSGAYPTTQRLCRYETRENALAAIFHSFAFRSRTHHFDTSARRCDAPSKNITTF